MTELKIKEGLFYIKWLGEERQVIHIAIKDIYCKHESNYGQYRNNYVNQLRSLNDPSDLEYKRNVALCEVLKEKGWLYPIALLDFEAPSPQGPKGYLCVDGHHRIKAHLTLGYDKIPGIVYKTPEESGKAKGTIYDGDQHGKTLDDFKDTKNKKTKKKKKRKFNEET